MIRKNYARPLYREIIREALSHAWHERRLWLLALLAGVLQTGGILDVFVFTSRNMAPEAATFYQPFQNVSLPHSLLASIGFFGKASLALLLIAAILGLSVIAQGALVAALGGRVRGKHLSLRESVRAGVKTFWSIALLNVLTLGAAWIARFFALAFLAWTVGVTTIFSVSMYLLVSVFFLVCLIAIPAIHFFSLNALILQKSSLAESLARAWHLLKHSWVIILETAVLLFVVGVLLFAVGFAIFAIASIPLLLLLLASLLLQHGSLFWIAYVLAFLLFFAVMLATGAFTISFQYATWNHLYRRLGEGSALARLHRWLRWFGAGA